MGRIRGKRNRDSDRYWHERRRAEQTGMVGAADVVLCEKCGASTPRSEVYKGWCLTCVGSWVETVDPLLIAQAKDQLPLEVLPLTMIQEIERLQERIIHDAPPDEAFLPLTQFMGLRGIGHQRALWNFLQALYVFELESVAEATRLGVVAPNTVHLCGRHAPVQRMSIQGFLSRIHSAADAFHLWKQDRRFADYIRGFVSDNRLSLSRYRPTGVDVYDRFANEKMWAKVGRPHFDKHTPTYWPFEGEYNGRLRAKGELEELPDIVMEIGQLVPKHMPWSLREDLCQDLVVAVLSGDATIDGLRENIKYYVRQAFEFHPLKYGRYTLEVTEGYSEGQFDHNDGRQYRPPLTDEDADVSRAARGWLSELCVEPRPVHEGWHAGRNRPVGLMTVGEQLREKRDGHAIDGPHSVVDECEIDPDVAEVFYEEQHPRWRRKFK